MTQKHLTFTPNDRRFKALHNLAALGHAICAQTPKGMPDARDLPKMRLDAKYLRAAHAISEPDPDELTSTREPHRRCVGGTLVLSVEAWERLVDVAKLAIVRLPDEVLLESEDALDLLIAADTVTE